MNAMAWFFTLLIFFLIIRTFIAVRRVRSSLSLEGVDPAMQLAILKENLLENPQESNLGKLQAFCREQGLDQALEPYEPLLLRQTQLRRTAQPLVEDDLLYEEQARWLDSIEPLEFREAREAHSQGDFEQYTRSYLDGLLRFYSDEKVLEHLGVLENTAHFHEDFPIETARIRELAEQYQNLCRKRDHSSATPEELETLRKAKQEWVDAVRDLSA